MSLISLLISVPLLWSCATAFPAGTESWTNSTSSISDDFSISAAYSLVETYDASNWLGKFDVQAIPDPTHGYVEYVNAQQAQQLGLLKTQNNQVYIGVDTWSHLDPNGSGRKSVRLSSKSAYNRALIIADFAHVPGSLCGSWPAYWLLGPSWPNTGEIDIFEGVHQQTYNQVTLHTTPGCVPSVGPGGESGRRIDNADCGANSGYVGCASVSNNPTSYGSAFNANGGGVYAMQWTSSGIKIWSWASRDVPGDIRNGNPNPDSWSQPMTNFGSGCDYNNKFRDMNIIFDITFCGDWAGGVWSTSSCAGLNPSCNAYVASQPQAFGESYWLINSVKVYNA